MEPLVEEQESNNNQQVLYQNVVVMRHSDRIDLMDEGWLATANCKWNPRLVYEGRVRAFSTGKQLREHLGDVQINRAFVSPFLRCLETTDEVVSALSATLDGDEELSNYNKATVASDGVNIDPSKIKVAVEYGLCKVLNSMKPEQIPEDRKFNFVASECESVLPFGTIDHNVEPVLKELPVFEETLENALARLAHVTMTCANKYPSENLLFVTHGSGVFSVRSEVTGDSELPITIDYCAYLHGRRAVYGGENQSFTFGPFELVGQIGIRKGAPQPKAV